ncbi:hypothetical protein [Pseudomonas aeruginosa]|uniref:hypothetical protein n=1 Tax=Pseudomonas aeruginosa TaxID=287 RepID=UPI001C375609|nr:hypothetical protein [Pseudomonas aeruginosa]
MDEPLFNELLESVKQADQIMTDHAELRRLAKRADALHGTPSLEHVFAITKFREAVEPKAILAMLDEIDRLRSRLEIDERTPHDGIACRDETIKVLDEKCDRLKAENEALRKDAERYRFLKDQGHFRAMGIDMGGNHSWTGMGRNVGCGPTVDEAIDAAIDAALEGAAQ